MDAPLLLPCTSCKPTASASFDEARSVVRCLSCGTEHPVARRELLLVTGVPGTGKSTLARQLAGRLDGLPVFDTDLLGPPAHPDWEGWACTWLLVAHGLAQSGLSTVLCGYGITRSKADRLAVRQLLGSIHVLNLDLQGDAIRSRLRPRPGFDAARIERKVVQARELSEEADIDLDVTSLAPSQIADAVTRWMTETLQRSIGSP